MDDGRWSGIGGDPARIVDRRVPPDIQGGASEIGRRQGQRHGHLVDIDGPLPEELGAIEEPPGPLGPGCRHLG